MSEHEYFIGVDVGTASVRAGLFSSDGVLHATETHPLQINHYNSDFYEQSSDDIWNAVSLCVKSVIKSISPSQIKGIGFDATCSLVLINNKEKNRNEAVSVNLNGDPSWNVIMWLDHRAHQEAESINSKQHPCLDYVGKKMSLEMQPPKLLWLKRHLPQSFNDAVNFFDLPDYLTWKATGNVSRSLCSLVCKWTYRCDESSQGWDASFWNEIGLNEFVDEQFQRIGVDVHAPGHPVLGGVSSEAARDLGLLPGTPVATSIIDAHAGVLGALSCSSKDTEDLSLLDRLVLISGTSSCHMTHSLSPRFVPGIWGPYFSVTLDGLWLNEAGQSATGKLIDHVVQTHPAFDQLQKESDAMNVHYIERIHQHLDTMASSSSSQDGVVVDIQQLTKHLHIWPDFHGNRSPLADPSLTGMVCGLTLSADLSDLSLKYLATIQSLAFGTRHIIETLVDQGQKVKEIILCGGLAKNRLFCQIHADVMGIPVVLPDQSESMLLGGAILAACASQHGRSVKEIMCRMGQGRQRVNPKESIHRYFDNKYNVFLLMYQHQLVYKQMMECN